MRKPVSLPPSSNFRIGKRILHCPLYSLPFDFFNGREAMTWNAETHSQGLPFCSAPQHEMAYETSRPILSTRRVLNHGGEMQARKHGRPFGPLIPALLGT